MKLNVVFLSLAFVINICNADNEIKILHNVVTIIGSETLTINGSINSGVELSSGVTSNAFKFDGNVGHINIDGKFANFNAQDFTISFWIKTNAQRLEAIFAKREKCNFGNFFSVRMSKTGQLNIELDQDDTGLFYASFSSQKAINDGSLHHIAMSRKETTLSLYIDGYLDSSNPTPVKTNLSNNTNIDIGFDSCTGVDGTQPFSGILDKIVIYEHSLSEKEILQNYINYKNNTMQSSLSKIGLNITTSK
jgi:hypothetical protein